MPSLCATVPDWIKRRWKQTTGWRPFQRGEGDLRGKWPRDWPPLASPESCVCVRLPPRLNQYETASAKTTSCRRQRELANAPGKPIWSETGARLIGC